jgi:hypothetical protein
MMQQMGMMPPRFQEGGLNSIPQGMRSFSPSGYRYSAAPFRMAIPGLASETPAASPDAMAPTTPVEGSSQFGRDIGALLPTLPSEETMRRRAEELGRRTEERAQGLKEARDVADRLISEMPPGSPLGDYFRTLTPEQMVAREEARKDAEKRAQEEVERLRREAPERGLMEIPLTVRDDGFDAGQQAGFTGGRDAAMRAPRMREDVMAPAPEKKEGDEGGGPTVTKADLLMEGIRSRREEMKAAREEAKGLALIQAGLAMAAGRSSNALSNIAAGGMSGIQALRESQRDIRKEERELMSDEMKIALAREELGARAAERKESREARASESARALSRENAGMLRLQVSNIDTRLNALGRERSAALDPNEKARIDTEIAMLNRERTDALNTYKSILAQLGANVPQTPQANSYSGFSAKVVPKP